MKNEKKVWERYQDRYDYIIKVLRSCTTEEEVDVVIDWGRRLFTQWASHDGWYNMDGFGAIVGSVAGMFTGEAMKKCKELSEMGGI